MKVLVTGTTGQLAQCLMERSTSRAEIEIVTVGRPELDLEIPGSAERVIGRIRPDLVINAAAFTAVDRAEDEPDLAWRINADAAGEIAAASARAGARIVQISTDYVFDGRSVAPYTEETSPSPINIYGRSKLAGEEQVRSANVEHVIVRSAWIYSPFGHNFVKTMIRLAASRDELTVVDDQVGSPTSALDLAEGLLHMIDRWRAGDSRQLGETYHLAGTGSTSWYGFAKAIMSESRRVDLPAATVRPIATTDWPTRAARPSNSVLSSAKFAQHFGFAMPPWRKSLAGVVEKLGR
jgi:dTDP-4-dehydrorhamnose reductase